MPCPYILNVPLTYPVHAVDQTSYFSRSSAVQLLLEITVKLLKIMLTVGQAVDTFATPPSYSTLASAITTPSDNYHL